MAGGFQVEFTNRAQEELDAILRYYLANYGEVATRRVYESINEKLLSLELMPDANPPYSPINRSFKRAYRFVIAKKRYKIIYTIILNKDTVRITTIRHVKSDPGLTIQAIEEE